MKSRLGKGAMRRRHFITLIGGAAAALPLAARAQQATKTHHIVLVHPSVSIADMRESGGYPNYAVLFKELRRLGYIEGGNLVVTRYSGEGREERFPELCQEVVRTKPDVIVTSGFRLVLAFKAATATVPVVAIMADPVPFGIVTNIARPGGNITGISVEAGLDIWKASAGLVRSCPDGSEGRVSRFTSDMEPAGGECVAGSCPAVGYLSPRPAHRKPDPRRRISPRIGGNGAGPCGWGHHR